MFFVLTDATRAAQEPLSAVTLLGKQCRGQKETGVELICICVGHDDCRQQCPEDMNTGRENSEECNSKAKLHLVMTFSLSKAL